MRTLIFYILVFLSKQLLASYAENQVIINGSDLPSLQKIDVNYYSLSYSKKNQDLNIDQSVSSERTSLSSSFKYKKMSTDLSFTNSKNDYSSVNLRNKNGTEEKLSDSFNKNEFYGSAALSSYIGAHNFSTAVGSSLTQSPYFQSSQQVQYFYRGQHDSYKAGLSIDYQTTNQPENYFINRNFQTQKSPDQLKTQQVQLFYEQVLSDDFKVQAVNIYGQRADRPNNKGYILKTGYSINQKFFLRNQLGTVYEEKSELKNNRGYYSSQFFDAELSYLYSYKLQLQLGYGLNIETEKQTFNQSDTQVGHDIYTVGSRYRLAEFTILANIDQRQSNLGTNEYNFSGGFSWNL